MTKKMIPGRFRYADAHDMYKLLGLPNNVLPVEGMPEREIHGVRVYVKPLTRPVETSGRSGRLTRRNFQGLRVMAICECGQHLAVGRLHQHKCIKREYLNGLEKDAPVLSLRIRAEQDARRQQGLPKSVVESAIEEIIEADKEGWEWVGAMGGLRYDRERKEWS